MFRVEKHRKFLTLKINGVETNKVFIIIDQMLRYVRLKASTKFDPLNAAEIIRRVVFEESFVTETFQPQNMIKYDD